MAAERHETLHPLLRVYADLNDFLPGALRGREISCSVSEPTSVKDLIERHGIPHTEVDLILVDGEPSGFGRLVTGAERVSVYPVFRSLDISAVTLVRAAPAEELRFIVDVHLGKLARYLRLLGFDAAFRNEASDDWLAKVSADEDRTLLTRDRRLLMRSIVVRGYCVRADEPEAQAREVVLRFGLASHVLPFSRCIACNHVRAPAVKASVASRIGTKTRVNYEDFHECKGCDRVYWKGSHYDALVALADRVTDG